jgi:hypothetical protein
MDVFNNRELATVIWLTLLMMWCFTQPAIRNSFGDVVKAFLVKAIVIPFILMTLYIVIVIFSLNAVGLWEPHQLKNTLVWYISTAAVSFFRINSISEDSHYYRNTVKDNLKLLVVLQFLISFYTFNLLIELIIVPLATLLGAMSTISKLDRKYQTVERFINNSSAFFGAFLIAYTIYKLVADFDEIAKSQTIYDFAIPPLLTLLLLLYIYFMVLFVSYENAFVRLRSFIKNPSLFTYVRFKTVTTFNVNVELMKRWVNMLASQKVESKNEIKASIDKVFRMQVAERSPEDVPLSRGWSPYAAKDFLIKESIETGYYHPDELDEWFACSPLQNLGQEIVSNNIAYYVDGDVSIAKSLKLMLNVNKRELALDAHQRFLDVAKVLHIKSLCSEMPLEIEDAILIGCNKTIQRNHKKVSAIRNDWTLSNNNGYNLKFVVEHI